VTAPGFTEVADGVHVLRHPVLDVNVTLVVGDAAALLVDTLSTPRQASELAAAARAITPHPWTVVNTHHHFDHCFGNSILAGDPPRPVYAHETTLRLLRDEAEQVRQRAYEEMLPAHPSLAAELGDAPILAPTHAVGREAVVDLGGRRVELLHLGRGHTAGDLVVRVPDADVLVVGDLVEEGAPPSFEEAYPVEWPETLAELLRLTTSSTVVVPGHGAVVDEAFVRAQHADLATLAWWIREGHCDGAPPERVAEQAPFERKVAVTAVQRGYAELGGVTA
jgi:glyoxylase-like metal-dependent hydrolase (beta-lactamase superfamily II)